MSEWASQEALRVKGPPAVQETKENRSSIPGGEDALGEARPPTAGFLPRESRGQRAWRATVHGVSSAGRS